MKLSVDGGRSDGGTRRDELGSRSSPNDIVCATVGRDWKRFAGEGEFGCVKNPRLKTKRGQVDQCYK